MKFLKPFRLALAMIIVFSPASVTLFAQENKPVETEKKSQPRGRQGGGPGKKQQLTAEQRRQRFNEMIQKNVIDMAEKVEIRQNQKEAFGKLMFNYEVQNQLGRMKVQEANKSRDQKKRRELAQTLQKMYRATDKKVKEILDKEQFKTYQAAMKAKRPQGRQGRGGGQGQGR